MTEEKLEQIKETVINDLCIRRFPKKAKAEFIALAHEEFAGDYGMLVKWLLDFRKGILSTPNQVLMEQIEIMAQEIEQLKAVPKTEEKKKVIRSVSGTIITERGE